MGQQQQIILNFRWDPRGGDSNAMPLESGSSILIICIIINIIKTSIIKINLITPQLISKEEVIICQNNLFTHNFVVKHLTVNLQCNEF